MPDAPRSPPISYPLPVSWCPKNPENSPLILTYLRNGSVNHSMLSRTLNDRRLGFRSGATRREHRGLFPPFGPSPFGRHFPSAFRRVLLVPTRLPSDPFPHPELVPPLLLSVLSVPLLSRFFPLFLPSDTFSVGICCSCLLPSPGSPSAVRGAACFDRGALLCVFFSFGHRVR